MFVAFARRTFIVINKRARFEFFFAASALVFFFGLHALDFFSINCSDVQFYMRCVKHDVSLSLLLYLSSPPLSLSIYLSLSFLSLFACFTTRSTFSSQKLNRRAEARVALRS